MKAVDSTVLGRRIKVVTKTVKPASLDLDTYRPIETIFSRNDRVRRQAVMEQSKDTLDITVSGEVDESALIPLSELQADEFLTYRGVVLATRDSKVIYGHEIVRKALLANENNLSVTHFLGPLSARDLFAIAVRHAAKEGRLTIMARIEIIVCAKDDFGLSFKEIQKLLTPPKAKDSPTSESELRKEYIVGRWYQKYSGVKLSRLGDELTVESFSRLKMMAGNSKLLADACASEAQEAHFIHAAVVATKRDMPRFEANLRKIVAHPDTYETFKTGSLSQALLELKANYPEDSKESHPHYDFIAGKKKLGDPTIREGIAQFAKRGSSPTERAFQDLVFEWTDVSPALHRALLTELCKRAPELYLEVGVSERPDLLASVLSSAQGRFTKATKLLGLK